MPKHKYSLNLQSPVLVVHEQEQARALWLKVLQNEGFKHVSLFDSYDAALQKAFAHQFRLFIVGNFGKNQQGIVFIQRLRESQEYGVEPHLLVVDCVTDSLMNVCLEYELSYLISEPITYDKALQKFKYVVKTENSLSDVEIHYRMARACLKHGLVDAAKAEAERLLELEPRNEKLLLLLCDCALSEGRADLAEKWCMRALASNHGSIAASHKLAQAYMMGREFAKAARLMDDLVRRSPYNLSLLCNAGISYFENKEEQKAEEAFAQVLRVDPQNQKSREIHAQLLIESGRIHEIHKVMQGADPEKLVKYLNNKGVELARLGKLKDAILLYDTCIPLLGENNPRLYGVHFNKALAYMKLQQYDKALDSVEKSIQCNPYFRDALSLRRDLRSKCL